MKKRRKRELRGRKEKKKKRKFVLAAVHPVKSSHLGVIYPGIDIRGQRYGFLLYFRLFEIFYFARGTAECFGGGSVARPEKRDLSGIEAGQGGREGGRERKRERREKSTRISEKAQCGNSLGHDRHYHNFFSMSPNEGDTECVEGVRRASRQTTGQAKQVGFSERAKGVKGAPGVSLCARPSRGVQLNELPVLVPLVAHNSRLSLFRFRLSPFLPPLLSPSGSFRV